MTVSTRRQSLGQHQSLRDFTASRYCGTDLLDGFEAVVTAIAEGARDLESQIRAAGLAGVLGATEETNVQGEVVQRLDNASSDTFVEALRASGRVAIAGCEELEEPVIFGGSPEHRYIVLMDPLDGSSNIDVAVSIGSIFGVWARDPHAEVAPDSLLRPGSEQVAAVYVVYGSSTILTVATEGRVDTFTMDPASGEFGLTNRDLRFPDETPYYSVNDGNTARWTAGGSRGRWTTCGRGARSVTSGPWWPTSTGTCLRAGYSSTRPTASTSRVACA